MPDFAWEIATPWQSLLDSGTAADLKILIKENKLPVNVYLRKAELEKGIIKEAGKSGMPVLLKRGLCATIDEWLNAAEYIISEGNPNIVLCERGIRTYETSTRNTLDISAVPVIRQKSHLPVIVDPSHATGVRAM